jgi:hypothetical protein
MTGMLRSDIIPVNPIYCGCDKGWDFPAICIFVATGFFLNEDTYYNRLKVLKPATLLYPDGKQEQYFKWYYSPREITLKQATKEFAELFESIIDEQVGNQRVILPLSGGLDSRTQAAALKHLGKLVSSYCYSFTGGHDETKYGKQIAQTCAFPFEAWEVPRGYLWDGINQLARINDCYSEFTHPRQMAFIDRFASMGDLFSLGHWGDVFFDDMGVLDELPFELQLELVLKKILKKGGLELAESLWKAWGIQGSFEPYLRNRVRQLLMEIDIPHSANARIRAFKSLYWAPRWTSVNLSVFEAVRPITLPYYDDRMCRFICTIPEKYLSGRQIQIEYLKMRAPELARIPWQDHRPFNLYNYHWDKAPWNFQYRVYDRAKRTWNQMTGKQLIQRNWELQFVGEENDKKLREYLFDTPNFKTFIPEKLVSEIYSGFVQEDSLYYSHPLSMLLTLSMKQHLDKK